jgi:hypothetical protein
LLDAESIAEQYRRFSDAEIRAELDRYREYCHNHFSDLEADATHLNSHLKVIAPTGTATMALLTQSAFSLISIFWTIAVSGWL